MAAASMALEPSRWGGRCFHAQSDNDGSCRNAAALATAAMHAVRNSAKKEKIKHEKREHDHHGSFERFWRAKPAPIRNTHDPGHHHDRKPPGRDHSPRATAVVERWALPRPPPTASASPGEPGLCSSLRSRERSARAAAVNCASPRAPNPPHRCSYCPSRGPQAPPATRRRSANRLHRSLRTEQLRVPGRGVPH